MKIAMITAYGPPKLGGKELWIPQMAVELEKLGHEVRIFCSNVDEQGAHFKDIWSETNGIKTHKSKTIKDLANLSTPITIPNLRELLKFKPDIIHIHEPNLIHTTMAALFSKFFLKSKIVMHCHSDPFDWHGQGVLFKIAIQGYALIHKLKLSLADWILVVSEEYKQYARFFKPHYHKLSVHLMSVSPVFKPLESVPKKMNQVLYIGRIDKRKGIDTLIQAMDGLENSSLLIVGDGDKELTQRLKEMSTNLIKDNPSVDIQFVGKKTQHELNLILNESSVLVLPTIDKTAETFGAVLIEAWATKTPVISANNPAPMGLIHQSGGGLVFERGNKKNLSECLKQILYSNKVSSNLADNGYRYVDKKLTYRQNAHELVSIYNSIILRN